MPDKQPAERTPTVSPTREKIHEIIFGADTFWGLTFDIVLLVAILASIVVVCMQTVDGIGFGYELDDLGNQIIDSATEKPKQIPTAWSSWLVTANWAFTLLFTAEYLLRLYCVRKPIRYVRSFWGIIDLLSFLPDYILLLSGASQSGRAFSVIRSLRLLRVFRVFQLGWFQGEADELTNAIWRSRGKIVVFLATVMVIVTVAGTLMYEVESRHPDSQFHSIPEAIYWAIVTMTTVGFGDIVPKSILGKFLSAILILLGYSLIIVPTGFVSAEIIETKTKNKGKVLSRSCPGCLSEGHDADSLHCKFCGERL